MRTLVVALPGHELHCNVFHKCRIMLIVDAGCADCALTNYLQ
jgi:hypothetical protein